MASIILNKEKMNRLFGIPKDFWNKSYVRVNSASAPAVSNEYAGNAHPHQEYLADLKVARVFVEQQLKHWEEADIIKRIDKEIEETRELAIKEINTDYKYNASGAFDCVEVV